MQKYIWKLAVILFQSFFCEVRIKYSEFQTKFSELPLILFQQMKGKDFRFFQNYQRSNFSEIERELAFEWFTSLLGEEADLDTSTIHNFFIENILQYNTGVSLDHLFLILELHTVNIHEGVLLQKIFELSLVQSARTRREPGPVRLYLFLVAKISLHVLC